ncbi:3-isopropylmalate/(R)-2-methylmalate dehydratase large subunit [Dethiosulfatibacter aminovorans DSM 17477]|uniref:3-isopropylmalate/(R)-2-methylmalate dehydratase large subunit n=1 Tax=Dethiosulfatibacter aminovorans DSM 17477 TaxID=1121476 RepID=A0A1M6A7M2_9FIRM|nr:aconitase/3-isopropylmalate dehydratase large subunit family protein [Dethiosulfatibacter aminovorans]SHI32472.1 3-isopropylmalate/(R)-2-methylmalate dehydratase large subunit [Dethiosulfatibacter aminovorans DSM 17477]
MIEINIIERIIAKHAGVDTVTVGEELSMDVDLAIAHDVTAPMAIEQFKKIGVEHVFDKKKIALVSDHNIPCASVNSRVQHKTLQSFADDYGVHYYGRSEGVIHQVISEENLYKKGDIIVGADSHTCTAGAYGVVAIPVGSTELAAVMALGKIDFEVPVTNLISIDGELNPGVYAKDIILHVIGKFGTNGFTDEAVIFSGNVILGLTNEEKMTISNMMIEMGAMIGFIDQGDEEIGEVHKTYKIDASSIVPCVACPSSPGNVKPVAEVAGVRINQVVLGSCTNGRYSDMKIAADILKDRVVAPGVNMIVVPGSKSIAQRMDDDGLTKIFRDAGAMVTNPGCGPCFGAHQGLLNFDDVAVSSTNRNFPGRMGHKDASIYLASPRIAAESAVEGCLTVPGTVEPLEVK